MLKIHNWQFYALGSALFAALTTILGKLGVTTINSNLATLIRTLVILMLVVVIVTYQQQWQLPAQTTRSLVFLILSGLTTGISWLCYYRALQLGNASQVAPVDKLSVVIVVLLAIVFLQEKLTWKIAISTLLITAGTLLMVV